MVRKVIYCFLICVLLVGAFCTQANAETHSVYDNGSLGTTYITYFKDIISGADFRSNYVAFRSGQYSYTMVVGELQNNNGVISLVGQGTEYVFSNTGNYNSQYTYDVNTINDFSLNTGNYIIYSDVGNFPELVERGAKFEILTTILFCTVIVGYVIRCIFYHRPR